MLSENKELFLIGIDGPCASGKTTLAQRIAEATGAQVIHADDFFLPHVMKTPGRMAQPGGNVHHERFADEVTSGIASGQRFEYGVYRCSEGRITEKKTVVPQGIIIVEDLRYPFSNKSKINSLSAISPDKAFSDSKTGTPLSGRS